MRASPHMLPVPFLDGWNNRCVLDPVLHEHMVETEKLKNEGVKSGAIMGDAVMVGIPQGWRLVAAPLKSDSSAHSLIFWEPLNDDDHTPSDNKVVHDLCHRLALTKWHEGGGVHPWS